MRYFKIFILFLLAQFIGCGAERAEEQENGSQGLQSGHLGAVIANYEIRIDNIPLVEPQTERVELTLSEYGVKYEGRAEITVAGEKKVTRRASILNFKDSSLAFFNLQDSTYTLSFFNPAYPQDDSADTDPDTASGLGSGYSLSLMASQEREQVGAFENCVKYDLLSSGPRWDSIPSLKGHLWVKPDYTAAPILQNYYRALAAYFGDPKFKGLEIWRVFNKLGIPGEALSGILMDIDGLIVRGEFTCQMFSLGKRANVSIKLELKDLIERRIPLSTFGIPSEYRPALGREAIGK